MTIDYNELMIRSGWVRGRACASCSGVRKYNYTNPKFPEHVVEIYPDRGFFRLKISGKKMYSGSLESLKIQHFTQN